MIDPYRGSPAFIQIIDTFDDAAISAKRWDTKVVVGSTTVTEAGGNLVFENLGAGTAGISYLPTKRKFPRYIRISADFNVVDGDLAADGEHCEASLVLYKDVDNWLKIGPYRDTSEGVNCYAFLRANQAGVPSSAAIVGGVLDNDWHTYTLVLLEYEIVVYVDDVLFTSFEWEDLVGYTCRLEAGTQNNADHIHVDADYFEVQSSFDFSTMQIGYNLDYIRSQIAAIPGLGVFPFTGNVTLTTTNEVTLDFLASTYGTVFRVFGTFDLGCAVLDYFLLYDSSLTTYYDYTVQARNLTTRDSPLVPVTGAGVNDCAYFCMVSAAWKQLDVNMEGGINNTDNTIVWEYWNGGAWAALTVTDGTVYGGKVFGKSGRVTWTKTISSTAVSGVTGYWVRARVTAAGTSLPTATRVQGVLTATATGFDSNAAFFGSLEFKAYRKTGAAWQTAPIDYQVFTQGLIAKNINISNFDCYSDTRIGLRLVQAPTRNVVIPYSGYVYVLV